MRTRHLLPRGALRWVGSGELGASAPTAGREDALAQGAFARAVGTVAPRGDGIAANVRVLSELSTCFTVTWTEPRDVIPGMIFDLDSEDR